MKKMMIGGLIALILFGHSVWASDTALLDQIKKKFPNTPIDSVRPAAIAGLYEVTSGRNILYIDKNLRYALFGGMIDIETGINLTDARMLEINKIDVSKLPLKNSITLGTGKKHIYIFSDPDCPFCQKLHPELSHLKDVTIHVFLYPVKELHPNAFYHAVAVWCSIDQKAALDQIFAGKLVEDKVCENPIGDNVALGHELQITGTPTTIFEDGTMAVGYLQTEAFQARIDGKNPERVAGSSAGMIIKETK